MRVSIYLSFDGCCGEAFDFYAAVLGGNVDVRQTWGDSSLGGDMPAGQRDRILHASLSLPGGERIMGTDAPDEWRTPPGGYAVAIDVTDPLEGARIFAALAEGGNVRLAYGRTLWASGFGLLADRYGVQWTVNCAAETSAARD